MNSGLEDGNLLSRPMQHLYLSNTFPCAESSASAGPEQGRPGCPFCPFDKRLNGGSIQPDGAGCKQENIRTLGSPGLDLTAGGPCSPERGWEDADAFHPGRGSISPGPGSGVLRGLFGLAAEKAHKKALLKYIKFSGADAGLC